jgi:hypothetical protein
MPCLAWFALLFSRSNSNFMVQIIYRNYTARQQARGSFPIRTRLERGSCKTPFCMSRSGAKPASLGKRTFLSFSIPPRPPPRFRPSVSPYESPFAPWASLARTGCSSFHTWILDIECWLLDTNDLAPSFATRGQIRNFHTAGIRLRPSVKGHSRPLQYFLAPLASRRIAHRKLLRASARQQGCSDRRLRSFCAPCASCVTWIEGLGCGSAAPRPSAVNGCSHRPPSPFHATPAQAKSWIHGPVTATKDYFMKLTPLHETDPSSVFRIQDSE